MDEQALEAAARAMCKGVCDFYEISEAQRDSWINAAEQVITAYLEASGEAKDKGPWYVDDTTAAGPMVLSGDFDFDVKLTIDGDFADGERLLYARWLADVLNREHEAAIDTALEGK